MVYGARLKLLLLTVGPSGLRMEAWVQIPLLTRPYFVSLATFMSKVSPWIARNNSTLNTANTSRPEGHSKMRIPQFENIRILPELYGGNLQRCLL